MRIVPILILLLAAGCSREPAPPPEAEESGAMSRAIDELRQQYEELSGDTLDDPVKWAAEDIENIGDWDYRVVDIEAGSADDLEATLNELGNDRWEVFWVERTASGYRVMLKKPSISYLSKIPLSQLGRFIVPGPDEGQ